MRTTLLIPGLLAAMLSGCILVDEGSELTIVNESSFDFLELRLAPVDSGVWGPNELRGDPLFSGDSITVGGISCDTYDVLIVDDTITDCVLEGVSLCLNDSVVFGISNRDLALCDFAR